MIGDRNSYVFGSILDGVFEGKIITERDAYYVEHAKHYFPTNRTNVVTGLETSSWGASGANPQSQYLRGTVEATTSTSTLEASSSSTSSSEEEQEDKDDSQTEANDKSKDSLANKEQSGIGFHSIIYKDTHVDDAYKDVREGKCT